ncbi:MAG: entericidin A/B family lipoprotein [Methylotenera sp.]|nr:entericidin A/B family lipoprotein [Methylotenera sp.]MDO9233012.1 entericidin A/B family lipoprotein [Methylotenera sp.]MDO9388548.1 entericidin A/B family lipoprotein [Methylotenera sp.]MDP2100896.1 entericidin A/B family lipoprotein [Methylotenera sp.]MDP2281578.1 entericidin A/B family lipoprotein [Methylotenera sp.]
MLKHFVLIALVIGIAGCNTIHGVGKDIEKAGEAVQKSTK